MLTLAADLQIHDGVVNKLLGGSLVRGSHKILGRPRAHIGRKGLPKEWAAHALTLTQAAAHNMYIYMLYIYIYIYIYISATAFF
jgi:hypothetical protein